MNLFDYSYNVSNKINFSGICYQTPNFFKYKNLFETYIINSREEFRPDIIAYELYGDDRLSWVLDEVNHFYTLSSYTQGRRIYYLPIEILIGLGIY